MNSKLTSDPDRVFELVSRYTPISRIEGMKGIGIEVGGELVAGVIYGEYNTVNVWMHVAIAPGRQASMEFVQEVFKYPFIDLGCKRVSASVEARNAESRRLCEHLGFREEVCLKGAASDGGDIVLYVMWKEGCRYV